jgi:hypothetical protein
MSTSVTGSFDGTFGNQGGDTGSFGAAVCGPVVAPATDAGEPPCK